MDPQIQSVIDQIAHLWEMQEMMMQEDREFVSDDEKVLAIGPEGAEHVHALAVKIGAKRILEIGTSHGYSTLFLADAVGTDGEVLTLEKRPSKVAFARQNMEKAGVGSRVKILEGDARELLKTLDGPFDLVLIDARKDQYIDYFDLALPLVCVGGFIVADNMFRPEGSRELMKKYQEHVRSCAKVKTSTENVGWGLEVSEKVSD